MAANPKRKIAVLGGGAGSMGALWALTSLPNAADRFDITVYQMGWRLGGKGASGRNPTREQRIEEATAGQHPDAADQGESRAAAKCPHIHSWLLLRAASRRSRRATLPAKAAARVTSNPDDERVTTGREVSLGTCASVAGWRQHGVIAL